MVLTGSSEASGEVQDGAWWLEHRDGKGKKRCWLSQGKWTVRKGALTSLWPWRVTQQTADPQTYAFNLGSEAPSRGCLSCTLGLASLWARAVPQLTAAQLHLRARVPLVKPDILRGHLSGVVLKVGVPDVGHEPFPPQGEALILSSLPTVGPCAQGWAYGKIVSQLFLLTFMWFPSLFARCEGVTLPVLRFFSRENCSIYSCRFVVSMGGGDSGSSYIAILNWIPLNNLLYALFTWLIMCEHLFNLTLEPYAAQIYLSSVNKCYCTLTIFSVFPYQQSTQDDIWSSRRGSSY